MHNLKLFISNRLIKKAFFLILIIMFLSLTIFALKTFAIDSDSFGRQNIQFYSRTDTTCSNLTPITVDKVSKLRGDNNGQKVFNFWIDAGLTKQQSAGITGGIKNESGFSPFRQQSDKTWPEGGWGIAMFTDGEREGVKASLIDAIGKSTFDKYYSADYGGVVVESSGFIPAGTETVNDSFLLTELNFLFNYLKSTKPTAEQIQNYRNDYSIPVGNDKSIFEYIKTLDKPDDAASSWTYFHSVTPGTKTAGFDSIRSAKQIMALYGTGLDEGCGGDLVAGGMDLDQAVAFMDKYKNSPDSANYIGRAGRDCSGGPLANCVSFSVYFINKYTSLSGFIDQAPGNGSTVARNAIARNPSAGYGNSPKPYAIFSVASGVSMCDGVICGHTGVILGVDLSRKKVIVGEAGCGSSLGWSTAREYDLSKFDDGSYTYIYTDGLLKGGL
ncbi:MAG TPA: phage tail tip lysozyme [Candidatus Saccharibacteria bacterium]|nr:phage tail tip lysozyme [Candidatus Saccharibacteria bacterium]HRQ07079.1 phage tail tip lysozyme [Candidatus Saccharibacteria bacterium]